MTLSAAARLRVSPETFLIFRRMLRPPMLRRWSNSSIRWFLSRTPSFRARWLAHGPYRFTATWSEASFYREQCLPATLPWPTKYSRMVDQVCSHVFQSHLPKTPASNRGIQLDSGLGAGLN